MQRQQDEKHKKKGKLDILAMLKPASDTKVIELPTGEKITVSNSAVVAAAQERAATQIQSAQRARTARREVSNPNPNLSAPP